MEIEIEFKKVRPGAIVPAYAHSGLEDAGLDLAYCGEKTMSLAPGERQLFPTGIAIRLPLGFEAQIRPRSGLALARGLTVMNAPGTVDPGYRGEVCVLLVNLGNVPQCIDPGERIAQLVVGPYAVANLLEVTHLVGSDRGEGGFGSTGRQSSHPASRTTE